MFKKLLIGILAFCFLGVSLAISAWYYLLNYKQQPINIIKPIVFVVPKGVGPSKLGQRLANDHIINSAQIVPLMSRFFPKYRQIKAGSYELLPGMSFDEMMDTFIEGKEVQLTVKFVEGSTFKDWKETLKNNSNLQFELNDLSNENLVNLLNIEEGNIEGWLYPDTYKYPPGSSEFDIIKRAHKSMKHILKEEWQKRASNLPYKNPYEMLIMASIIEKETAKENERAKVASVFINRLEIGMRLQTDPTVIYGMGENYNGKITRKDLREPTAYNTYVIQGLPPTPIAMPSKKAIQAAAHPENTEYLFFVADGKGGHVFSETLSEHNAAVQKYLSFLREKNKDNS